MPNHVRNIVSFNVSGEKLNEILNAIKLDEEGIGSIDFNKLIPMPPELNIEKGSNTQKGCELFSGYVNRAQKIINILNNPNIDDKQFTKAVSEQKELIKELNGLSGENKHLFDLGKLYNENVNNYGYGDWYEWSVANWDTKWNAFDFSHYENAISFSTAWSAPDSVIRAISEKYPDVEVFHSWADEDIGTNLGEREYKNGDIVYQHIPDSFSKEAYDMAFETWGAAPEEYGLKLNSAGTEYIESDKEETLLLPEADDEDLEM